MATTPAETRATTGARSSSNGTTEHHRTSVRRSTETKASF